VKAFLCCQRFPTPTVSVFNAGQMASDQLELLFLRLIIGFETVDLVVCSRRALAVSLFGSLTPDNQSAHEWKNHRFAIDGYGVYGSAVDATVTYLAFSKTEALESTPCSRQVSRDWVGCIRSAADSRPFLGYGPGNLALAV
jgi:hypothetical protein